MQAWIVKHKDFEGVYLKATEDGRVIASETPQVWWSGGIADFAVARSKSPDGWQVVEVEITEK